MTRSFKLGLFLIFVVAVGIRLSYFLAGRTDSYITPDSPGYMALAESLRADGTYATEIASGAPGGFPSDLQRPPGYPVFLLVLNPLSKIDQNWTALAQSILGGIFAAILALLISRLTNSITGILTGIFYSVDWITIVHTPMIMADLLFSIALTLTLIAYWYYLRCQRVGLAALAGLGLGITALIKPAAQIQLITFFLAWLIQPRRRWGDLVLPLIFLLCVSPWIFRNYSRYEIFTLSAIPTVNLYFFSARAASENLSGSALDARVWELDQKWNLSAIPYSDRERLMREEAKQGLRDHWQIALKQAVYGLLRTSFGTGRETLSRTIGARGGQIWSLWHTVIPLAQLALLYGLGLTGLIYAFRRTYSNPLVPRNVVFLFSLSVLLSLIPAASPVGYSRFRVHAVPMMCFLAALGMQYMFDLIKMVLWRRTHSAGI